MNRHLIKIEITDVLNKTEEQLNPETIEMLATAISDIMDEDIELRANVRDNCINSIRRKREVPEFHGKTLHDFKNEFNTMYQTLGRLQFEDVSKPVLSELCLWFAVWGAKNLSDDMFGKVTQNQKSDIDLDYIKEELDKVIKTLKPDSVFGYGSLYDIATHFYKLGINDTHK